MNVLTNSLKFVKPVKQLPKIVPKCNQTPKCINCKFSIKQDDYLVCKIFKFSSVTTNNKVFDYYIDTDLCRGDENYCGPDGTYYIPKTNELIILK